jgi:hypothetical protein
MGELIAKFSDGSYLEFSRGRFDAYCVFEVTPDGKRVPPRDTDYFNTLIRCGEVLSKRQVYDDFVVVYELTSNVLDAQVIKTISDLAERYSSAQLDFSKAMTMVYAGMIAENNKAFTKLGKRIKRLGLFMLLNEDGAVEFSANFMRGKGWQEIDRMCRERGF